MSKYEERFLLINEILKKEFKIIGSFLDGSVANGSFDEYSDLDIRFILEEEDFVNVVDRCKKVLDPISLFFEPCSFTNAIIIHFKDFFKADIFFYTKSMMKENAYFKGIKIIEDQDDFLKKIKNDSLEMQFTLEEYSIFSAIDKYVANVHECYRRIKRGEYIYANELLIYAKKTISTFENYILDNPDTGFSKAEKKFSSNLISLFNEKFEINSDNINLLKKTNETFYNQILFLEKEGKIKIDLKKYEYLIIAWIEEFEKHLNN